MKRMAVCILLLACFISAAGAEKLEDSILFSFYDNSIIFGDSITGAFKNYVMKLQRDLEEPLLEKTRIIGVTNMTLYEGSFSDLSGECHWSFQGVDMTMYGMAKVTGAEKVLILLGINDPVGIKIDKALSWVEYIVEEMERVSPVTEVYFFSETPVGMEYCRKKNRPEYQEQLDEYNQQLEEMCEKISAYYIEIAEPLKGEDNHLNPDYSSDMICHLNPEGMDIWLQCMKDYAQEQYEQGLWDPFEGEENPAESY